MMIPLLLTAAALASDMPHPDARPACTMRQLHVPAGKLNHAAQAVDCAPAKGKPVRESRVERPRAKT